MSRKITVLVIGAGNRGKNYSSYALCYPDRMKTFYEDKSSKMPLNWIAAAEREKFADAVIIATPDRLHKAPAVAFAQKKYHILLEKPMAVTAEDCVEVVRTCESNRVILAVCHVLRYHPVYLKIKVMHSSEPNLGSGVGLDDLSLVSTARWHSFQQLTWLVMLTGR
ncbi:hypothetical protein L345_16754, partial [Ophiophagus hannah]